MSIRQYRPRPRSRGGASPRAQAILYLALALAVGLQIAYPLIHGDALRIDTIATVYVAAFMMVLHSYLAYGFRFALTFLVVTFGYALGIEAIGVRTGWPFGTYHYSPSLGLQVLHVPLLVPFAWMALTYPLFIAARKAASHWVFLYGGIGLMVWDLFLDPQMVDAGRWSWKLVGPKVPYEPMIPLSNSAGWLFAGMGLMAILNKVLPHAPRKKFISALAPNLYLYWSLVAGILSNVFFFHHPHIAIFAGTLFAIVIAPYFFQRRLGRPDLI